MENETREKGMYTNISPMILFFCKIYYSGYKFVYFFSIVFIFVDRNVKVKENSPP